MAILIYRYKEASPTFDGAILARVVHSSTSIVGGFSEPFLDVSIEETVVSDLDVFMGLSGYVRVATSPTTPIAREYMDTLLLTSASGSGVQPQSNRAAIVDPTPADDSANGYLIGAYWINTATQTVWRLVDETGPGAAVWIQLQAAGGPGAGSIIYWGNDRINGTGTRQFLTPGYDDQVAKFFSGRTQIPAPAAGTLQDMTVFFNQPYSPPPAVTGVLDFILVVNGVDTLLKVVGMSADTAVVVQNTTDTVPIVAKDLMTIAVDKRDPVSPAPPPININTPTGIVVTFRWT